MPHVIGTAGHVDHGKSTLVLGLTGTDPDRLAEEKARGMTIDLGFAWTTLPSGREVGFVDVPGHERFVHNMLAGVGGVDCALFVVDAAEGWRPQSAEHLAILDLLGIATGVVALTKTDLVDTPALERVRVEVAARLAATTLAGAEIVATAAPSGRGLDGLRLALDRALDHAPEPPDRSRPRLPVDRVFSVRGSGTVVTGTLAGGTLAADGEAELLPAGRRVRIRGLQGHGAPLARATPARRLAVNLGGVGAGQVARGDVLVLPGQWASTRTADCRLRCLPGAPAPLSARGAYLLYAGAAETAVRLQPLDAVEVRPGQDALVRLHLERPLVLDAFEPVVLRDSGRDETVGGGRVLDPFPPPSVRGTAGRVRRAEQLEAREAAGRAGLLGCVVAERGVVPLADLPRLAATGPSTVAAVLADAAAGPAGGQATGRAGVGSPASSQAGSPAGSQAGGPAGSAAGGSAGGQAGGPAGGQAGGRPVRTRSLAWSPQAWDRVRGAVVAAVTRLHAADPSAPGLPAAAARQAASLALAAGPTPTAGPAPTAAPAPVAGPVARPPSAAGPIPTAGFGPTAGLGSVAGAEMVEALVAEGTLEADGPVVRLPGHGIRLDARQQAVRARVEAALGDAGVTVFGEGTLAELGADRRMAALLVRLGVLTQLGPGQWMGIATLQAAVRRLRQTFADGRPFAATEAKEALGTTRKTAIPLLEYLDRTGVTVRQGDTRRLATPASTGPAGAGATGGGR